MSDELQGAEKVVERNVHNALRSTTAATSRYVSLQLLT
jgi:hypothetical protein